MTPVILLLALIALIVFLIFHISDDRVVLYYKITGYGMILSSVTTVLLLSALIINDIRVDKIPCINDEVTAVENIVSLNDSTQINGTIYMRSGYINEYMWYQYMVDIGNERFVYNKALARDSVINYTDSNPRVVWIRSERPFLWFKNYKVRQEIYVPRGSISNEFAIDLR